MDIFFRNNFQHWINSFDYYHFNSKLGFFAIYKTFAHMNKGFGPNNIKIIGNLMVTLLSSILAITMQSGESAAIGILGAVVGYLFGYDDKTNTPT